MDTIVTEKKCGMCGVIKSIEKFSKSSDKYNKGYQRHCKQCQREYLQTNKERVRERKRAYNEKNRDRVRQKHKEYVEEHKERLTEIGKQWRTDNAEHLKQYKKDHRQHYYELEVERTKKHPNRNRIQLANGRARRENVPGVLTVQDWELVLDKYGHKCLGCYSAGELEIDHVLPMSRGGRNSGDNLQPLCPSCNARKSDTYIDYRPDKELFATPEILELGRLANLAESMRVNKGVKNGRAKLTEENVIEIINNKTIPTRELAKKFGVNVSIVNDIEAGRSWKHIQRP